MSDPQPPQPPPTSGNHDAVTEPVAAAGPPPPPPAATTQPSGIMRSSWLPAAATGLVGLLLGIVIGAVGIGLLSFVWHHASHRGDDRGQHWQDDRDRIDRGPAFR